MHFSSDAIADFEGLLEVNRKICKQQMAEKALENRGAKAEKITVTMDTSEDGGIYIQQVTIYLDKQNKPKALAAREVLEQQLGVSVVLDATG